MDVESQEMYDWYTQHKLFNPNQHPNFASWNQNHTEEMMNSYNSVPNRHSDMFYHHQQHQQHQQQLQEIASQQHLTVQQYEAFYEQHSYYQNTEYQHNIDSTVVLNSTISCSVQVHQNFDSNFDYPAMQHSVESCDSMMEGDQTCMNLSPPNMMATTTSTSNQYEQMCNLNNNDQEKSYKPFFCNVCAMYFARLYHLKRHFESGTHKAAVKDNNIEDPAEQLMQHYKQPKETQKYECRMCNKKYKNKISLKRHSNVHNHNDLKNVLWCQYEQLINSDPEACSSIDCSITA